MNALADGDAPMRAAAFDPLSADIRRCPHAHYAVLNAQPVMALPEHPNFYVVSGYETVSEVLMDPDTYDGQPFPDQEVAIMSAMRPEPHRRLRSAIQALFTNRALERLTPFIADSARRRTDALLQAGRGDLMSLWANPIPLSVIARLFGFPSGESDLQRLNRYGDAAIRLVIPLGGPGLPPPPGLAARWRQLRGLLRAAWPALQLLLRLPSSERRHLMSLPNPFANLPGYPRTGFPHRPELIHLIVEFQLEVLGIFRRHLRHPGDDVVDALVPEYREGRLSLVEILSSALQILVAGYETTANTLAHAVHRLAREPERLRALQADETQLEAFVEEVLRLDAPLQRTLRRTTREVRLAGVDLPQHAQLIVMLGAANLDAQRFASPERFDPQRANLRRHLSFGRGIHLCIGAQLARLESRIALGELIRRVDAIRLLPDQPLQRLTDKDIGMWGLVSLPVEVVRRSETAL